MPYENIKLLDSQNALQLFQAIAWILVVTIIVRLLLRQKQLPKQSRQIIDIVLAVWIIASSVLALLNAYTYINDQRPYFKQAIEEQKQITGN